MWQRVPFLQRHRDDVVVPAAYDASAGGLVCVAAAASVDGASSGGVVALQVSLNAQQYGASSVLSPIWHTTRKGPTDDAREFPAPGEL